MISGSAGLIGHKSKKHHDTFLEPHEFVKQERFLKEVLGAIGPKEKFIPSSKDTNANLNGAFIKTDSK